MDRYCFWPVLAISILQSSFAGGQVVINEFLPDPAGSDSGREFIELINNSFTEVSLMGVELQFANGAVAPQWLVRWVCDQDLSLGPGERFLVADRNWQGGVQADVETYLGLQNGPDAIRLVQGTSVLDLVGYGPLTDPELLEGTAVPVVAGLSLARRPDGHDSDDNSLDFIAAEPSPGEVNFQPYLFQVLSLKVEPPSAVRPGESITVNLDLKNSGSESIPTCPIVFSYGDQQTTSVLDGNTPGQPRTLLFRIVPEMTGKLPLTLQVPVPNSQDFLEIPLGHFQVGPGPLVLNEIMGSPDQSQGEWVELQVVGPNQENLDQYRIKDEGGNWVHLPNRECDSGELVVVAQDSFALQTWVQKINSLGGGVFCKGTNSVDGQFLQLNSWPSLNNSAPEGREFADRVYLCDSEGCVIDHVTIGWEIPLLHRDVPDGHSLERVGLSAGTSQSSIWAAALAQAGSTPGCQNSVNLPELFETELQLLPRVLDPVNGDVVINIGFDIEQPGMGWDLRIYDLWGQLVRDLGGEMHGTGPRQLFWDGRTDQGQWPPSGGYVVLLITRGKDGEILSRQKKMAVLRRPK